MGYVGITLIVGTNLAGSRGIRGKTETASLADSNTKVFMRDEMIGAFHQWNDVFTAANEAFFGIGIFHEALFSG